MNDLSLTQAEYILKYNISIHCAVSIKLLFPINRTDLVKNQHNITTELRSQPSKHRSLLANPTCYLQGEIQTSLYTVLTWVQFITASLPSIHTATPTGSSSLHSSPPALVAWLGLRAWCGSVAREQTTRSSAMLLPRTLTSAARWLVELMFSHAYQMQFWTVIGSKLRLAESDSVKFEWGTSYSFQDLSVTGRKKKVDFCPHKQ